jgi:UDP-N-acetylmuramyl pentapeptide synthase
MQPDSATAAYLAAEEMAEYTGGKWLLAPGKDFFCKTVYFNRKYPTAIQPCSVCFVSALASGFGATPEFVAKNRDAVSAIICAEEIPALSGLPRLLVKDARRALVDLACGRRRKFAGQIFSVIGSVGKSSACAMLAHALKQLDVPLFFNGRTNIPRGICKGIIEMPLSVKAAIFEVSGNA